LIWKHIKSGSKGILENEWPISEEILFTGRIKKVIDIHYKHSYNSKYSNYNYLNYKHYIIKEGDE
jgi:hypothetical protein